jgi:hypothetical protein
MVEVIVELENRRPAAIRRTTYLLKRLSRHRRLHPSDRVIDAVTCEPEVQKQGGVLDAGERFRRKRRLDETLWTPTPELEQAIGELVFANKRGRR